jgi:hypothetical protein
MRCAPQGHVQISVIGVGPRLEYPRDIAALDAKENEELPIGKEIPRDGRLEALLDDRKIFRPEILQQMSSLLTAACRSMLCSARERTRLPAPLHMNAPRAGRPSDRQGDPGDTNALIPRADFASAGQ